MSSDINSISTRMIQWRSLLGLASLQAAITLMWVVYNAYLVQLLAKFGFPNQWATYLLMIESLVSVLFEPIMGIFSDRSAKLWIASSPVEKPTFFKQWLVGRFPLR
jgi:Na+/melibiose symporter-like transporter